MVSVYLYAIRERIQALLARGLYFVSPSDFDPLMEELSALAFTPQAAQISEIRRNVEKRTTGPRDVASLVTILHVLSQPEFQLNQAMSDDKKNLAEAQKQCSSEDLPDLIEVINMPDPLKRGYQVVEYFRCANEARLAQSLEIVWFDSDLSDIICSGLRERPEEAVKLALSALNHSNRVITGTAIQVLLDIGRKAGYAQRVGEILHARRQRAKGPMKHIFEEAIAKVEGRYTEYLAAKQRDYTYHEKNLQQLRSSKKGERYAGMYGIAHIKDPYFTDVLAQTLAVESDKKLVKFLLKILDEIEGVEAISVMRQFFDGPYARDALDAVSKFGDRSVLTFLLNNFDANLPSAYYQAFLPRYGDLAVEPLLYTLKTLEHPDEYKKVFSTIFASFRSDRLLKKIIASIEQDTAFAEKFSALMRKMYAKQFKKAQTPGKEGASSTEKIARVARLAVGGTKLDIPNISGMFLTPDGTSLVVLVRGKGVQLFSTETWQQHASFNIEGYPLLMALSPDGNYLATVKWTSAQRTYCVEIREFDRQARLIDSFSHATEIHALAFTLDGRALLVGGEKIIRVVEFGAWRDITELSGHDGRVTYIQTIPDKNQILTGDWQGWLQVWDTSHWEQVTKLKSDSWASKYAEVSSDGKLLVYAGYIGIRVWDTATWNLTISAPKPKDFDYMTLTPDNKYLVVGKSKKLKFLDFGDWKEYLSLQSDSLFASILLTPDGKHAITSENRGIKVWHIS